MKSESKTKRVLKIILNIVLILLALIIVFIIGTSVVHHILLNQENELLTEGGYVKSVSAGDYNLNVYLYGNEDSEHTIVGLSGMGSTDYAVQIKSVTDNLADKNCIAIVDRAGYGLSDDTTKEQTIEQIISDYRTVLKNAGCDAPYILMAHQLGGVYATYWANTYPDEIETIIYLDATQIGSIDFLDEDEGWDVTTEDFVNAAACHLGLQRIFFTPFVDVPENLKEYDYAYWWHNAYSFAMYSQLDLCKENITKTYNLMQPNDIPKLYIDATAYTKEDLIETFSYINKQMEQMGEEQLEVTDEYINQVWSETAAKNFYNESIKPYIDKLGNCTYVNIAGDHYIFLQKPDEVTAACSEFLDTLK